MRIPIIALRDLAGMVLSLCLVCAPLAASGRSAPQPGPAPAVSLPAKVDYELPNGLKVTLVPFGTVPKTTIVVAVSTGAIAEGTRPGLASMAAELMKQGVGGGDASQLFRRAADLGGAVGITAGHASFSIGIDVLSEHGSEALDLLAQIIRHPTLPAQELPRLKADAKRALAISRSQQQSIAAHALSHRLFGSDPRGHQLEDHEVDAITVQDIRTFIDQEFAAGRTRIYLSGRFDKEAIERAIAKAFGDWNHGPPPVRDSVKLTASGSVQLIDRPGAKQSTILMGLPVRSIRSTGFDDVSMANAMLGGSGLMSRLDRNLREDKGWTYGVSTRLEPIADQSLWLLSVDVNTPDTADAMREIFREMRRLAEQSSDPAEITRVRNYRAGHFLMGASSREGLIGQLSFVDQYDLGPEWLTGYLQRLQAVTAEGVRQAAGDFDPSRMTVVVAGDLSRIKSAIEGLEALKGADFH